MPYKCAAWLKMPVGYKPAFVMERLEDNRYIVFVPQAGNTNEGEILIVEREHVECIHDCKLHTFKSMINNLGLGLAKMEQERNAS